MLMDGLRNERWRVERWNDVRNSLSMYPVVQRCLFGEAFDCC